MINLHRIRQSHRKFLSAHDSAVQRTLNDAREQGLDSVMTDPGFKPGPKQSLQKATTAQVIRTSRGSIVKLQNRKPYAAAIDKGARPHVIQARGGGVLRFSSSSGFIFRRRVNHPGNRPYHFLRRATTSAGHYFELRMTERMRGISRTF